MAKPTFVSETETAYDSATDPKTTSSISVLAGDRLVAYANNGDQGDGDISISGGSLTWSNPVAVSVASNCELWMWTATVDVDKSMTVTFDRAGAAGSFGGGVQVFRASDGFGNSASTNSTGGPSLAVTMAQANSAIVVASADWNAVDGASRTWRTVNSVTPTAGNNLERSYVLIGSGFTEYAAYYDDAGATGSKTVGLSAPVGQKFSIGAVEVKGTASSTSPKGRLSLLGVGL